MYVFCTAMINMSPIVNDFICNIVHNCKIYKAQDYLLTENAGSTISMLLLTTRSFGLLNCAIKSQI